MNLFRWLGVGLLLAAAASVVVTEDTLRLGCALVVGLGIYAGVARNVRRALRSTWPIVLFAGTLTLLQLLGGVPVTTLPVKTVAFFLFFAAAVRLVSWWELTLRARPGAWYFRLLLFAYFIRHFMVILSAECWRLLRARSLCLSRSYGRGSFRSLVAALVSLFARSMGRAERFYAAQLLNGLAE